MTAASDDQPGFAPDDDAPIPYMARTREYYAAIGYTTPYRWAHYIDAPFQPLRKPLAQSRIAIVTTAAPFDPAKGDQGPGAKYNGGAKFYSVYDGDTSKTHDLRISHIAYDRVHTSADDSGTWFPLPQLRRLERERRIGEAAPRFFGAPTNRSHRVTIETDDAIHDSIFGNNPVANLLQTPIFPHTVLSYVCPKLKLNFIVF